MCRVWEIFAFLRIYWLFTITIEDHLNLYDNHVYKWFRELCSGGVDAMVTLKNDTTYAFKGWFYYFSINILVLECKILYIASFRVRKQGKNVYEYKIWKQYYG